MDDANTKAWFIGLENDFAKTRGGVQICTYEYHAMLERCGLSLQHWLFSPDQALKAKLRRRLIRKPFPHIVPQSFLNDLRRAYVRKPPTVIFFNRVNLAPLALELRKEFKAGKFVLLSHGLMIMDELHSNDAAKKAKWLGKVLLEEKAQRAAFDLVFTLTQEECALESWLGSTRTVWIPRVVTSTPLKWNPKDGRVGFVGTLDHPPTQQALAAILMALDATNLPANFRLRIVGRPEHLGNAFASAHSFIEYLGPLSDADLEREAATWCCFAHPLFAFARGCSTKLAVALGWEIPILATPSGLRGYELQDGVIPVELNAMAFAKRLVFLSRLENVASVKEEIHKAAHSSPTCELVAERATTELRRLGLNL
jgi:hypothetical protein